MKSSLKKRRNLLIGLLVFGCLGIFTGLFTNEDTLYFYILWVIINVLLLRRVEKKIKSETPSFAPDNASEKGSSTAHIIEKSNETNHSQNTLSTDSEEKSNKIENHHVAGTSFRNKEIESLGIENDDYSLSKRDFVDSYPEEELVYQYSFPPFSASLIEDPTNEYDKNAIKVVINDRHIGFIKSGSCSHIKKLIDSDSIESINAKIYGGKYKWYYSDYDSDKDKEVYMMDKDERNYSVTLEINLK